MSEDNTKSLNGNATNPTPFEEFVRQQFELLHNRIDKLEASLQREVSGVEKEMVERFVQVSRQVRDLDLKVDVFIREQTYIKDDIRELRLPKN